MFARSERSRLELERDRISGHELRGKFSQQLDVVNAVHMSSRHELACPTAN